MLSLGRSSITDPLKLTTTISASTTFEKRIMLMLIRSTRIQAQLTHQAGSEDDNVSDQLLPVSNLNRWYSKLCHNNPFKKLFSQKKTRENAALIVFASISEIGMEN